MDNLAIKNSLKAETTLSGVTSRERDTSLEKLANTFRQLVTTAGTTFETGLESISQQAGISAVAKHTDTNPASDDYRDSATHNEDYSGSDRADTRDDGRNDVSGRDTRDDTSPRRDDNQIADGRDPHDAGANDLRRDSGADNSNTNDAAPRDRDQADTSSRPDNSNDQNSAQADEGGSDQSAKNANSADGASSNDPSATATSATAQQAAVAGANAGINVGNSLAGSAAKVETATKGETGQVAQNATQSGPIIVNADKGAAGSGANANTHTGPQANTGAAANQAQVQAQAQSNAEAGSTAQQQAQNIAKTLNPNDKVQINVNVNAEAEKLTSKPSSTLTSGTILAAADGKSANQTGQQNANGQAANGQNLSVAAVAQQAQAAQAQNQNQQNANQNNQAQAQVQAATAGKTASAGTAAQAGTGIHTGGAEAGSAATGPASASGPSQLTQQSQQAQQAQTENVTKEAPKGSSVTDQISVKISKALQAGNDRISIQLKPSELGRVDVKMELTQDGRVMAVVTAENKDTLDLLRRDASDLQKALQDAGMQLDSGDLSFNMRGEEGEMMADDQGGSGPGGSGADELLDGDIDDLILAENTNVISDSRIDVRA